MIAGIGRSFGYSTVVLWPGSVLEVMRERSRTLSSLLIVGSRRDLATYGRSQVLKESNESPHYGRDRSTQAKQDTRPRKNPKLCLRRRERDFFAGLRGSFSASGSGAHVMLLLVVLVGVLVAYPGLYSGKMCAHGSP